MWFALASAACGFAPGALFLIVTRVLQGVGAALLTPGSLAILEASFVPADRARAIGAWSGLGGVATAAGPLVGGYLISAASWRWIFFINVPIAAVVIAMAARHVPESRDLSVTGRIDYAGALAAVVFLTGVTFAFIEAPTLGWSSPAVLTMVAAGAVGLAAFLAREHTAASPMLPLSIFRVRQFAATNAVTFIVYAALTGATFLLPVQLQVVSGYSPLASGLALLPLTFIMLALSARSGRLATRIGPRLQMSVGPVVTGAGLALLTLSNYGSSYVVYVLPAVIVFGLGLAITVAPLTATAMSSAPAEHSGIASAVNNDVARFGGLLAVAVLPGACGHHRHGLPAPGRARRGVQDRGPHIGRAVRRRRAAGRVHDHQSAASAPPGRCARTRGVRPLRPRSATADNRGEGQLASQRVIPAPAGDPGREQARLPGGPRQAPPARRSAGWAQARVAQERQYRGHPPVDQLLAGEVELGEDRVDVLLDR